MLMQFAWRRWPIFKHCRQILYTRSQRPPSKTDDYLSILRRSIDLSHTFTFFPTLENNTRLASTYAEVLILLDAAETSKVWK